MKKILLPIEDTERSLKTLHYVRKNYPSEEAELVLMMVDESLGYSVRSEAEAQALKELEDKLGFISETLEGYKVSFLTAVGKAGVRIVRAARETGADLIVMTKSSKADMLSAIGTTTEYVVNNAPCDVVIVSEASNSRNEYRGLIYRTATGLVNLRGQLGDKQSECLLPSVNQDCFYHIEVTVGKVRFFHTAYNPETRNWDLPPKPGQEVTMDIAAGEKQDILVKADSTEGKADRIRIVNRDMKKEAVFSFKITAAEYDENGELKPPVEEEPETETEAEAEAVTEIKFESDAESMESLENRATMKVPRIETDPEPEDAFEEPEVPTFMPDAMKEETPDEEEREEKPSLLGKLFGSKKEEEEEVPFKVEMDD